jgi:DNA-binding transcriptional ArsR family regulator
MKIDEEFTITELETLKVISDPLRVQILELIGMACDAGKLTTVKQLAAALDLPSTKLYYHVNLLEKHDLIRMAETKVVSGIIEKHYQIRAKRIKADLNVAGSGEISRDEKMELALNSATTMFENAYQNIEKSFKYRLENTPNDLPESEKAPFHYGQSMLQLSPRQGKEFVAELENLIEKYAEINNTEGLVFGLTLAFNPNYHLGVSSEE